jgi:hypothetical protein
MSITFTSGRTLTSERIASMYLHGIVEKRFARNVKMAKTSDNYWEMYEKYSNTHDMLCRCTTRTYEYEISIEKKSRRAQR